MAVLDSSTPPYKKEMEDLFSSLIADAHKRYVQAVGKDKAIPFYDPSICNLKDLMLVIRKQNEKFRTFREQQRDIFDIISKILRPIEGIGMAFSGIAEQAFPPSQTIFVAVKILMSAAEGVSQAYNQIMDLFRRLQDFTTRLHFYTREKMSTPLRIKCIEIMAALFEVMLVAVVEINRGRAKAYFRRLACQGSPVQGVIIKLNRLVEGETSVVMAETLAEIKKAITMQHHIEEQWDQFRTEACEKSVSSNRTKIKEILRPSVFSEDHYRFLNRTQTPGTGEWIIQDSSFQAWVTGQTQLLWLSGNPGTGKSYLASRVISWENERLSKSTEAMSDSFAYFFFRDNRPETRSVHQALRDMAYQLAEDDDFYSKTILQNLQSGDDIKTVPSAFMQLVKCPITNDPRRRKIYLIIDGIDEAEPTEMMQLLQLLKEVGQPDLTSCSASLQVLLVGRPTLQDLITALQEVDGISLGQIVITTDIAAKDVKAFITEEVKKSRIIKRTDEPTKQKIIGLISEKVGGLFILAQYMLSDMNNNTHMTSILESVQRYPPQAEDMLRQTISKLQTTLSADQIDDLNEILIWVTCAQEILKLSEIIGTFELRFGAPPLNLEESLRGPYACFFALAREDGLTTADLVKQLDVKVRSPNLAVDSEKKSFHSPDYIAQPNFQFDSNIYKTDVTFFHASISEFFRKHTECISKPADGKPCIGFDTGEAALHILTTCLQVLTAPRTVAIAGKQKTIIRGAALWRYASWYWQEHLVAVSRESVSALDKKVIGRGLVKLLTVRKYVLGWTQEEESLKLFTDINMACLTEWMSDPDVLAGLGPNARSWVEQAVKKPGGLVEKIGRLYALAWLDPAFNQYVPTIQCLKIVHSVAYIQAGKSWDDSDVNWSQISPRQRIQTGLDWASDIPRSGHWYRRVGSTYLVFKMTTEAMEKYEKALAVDGNMVETYGRIAYCHFVNKDYGKALIRSLMCETLEEDHHKKGNLPVRSRDSEYSAWRIYNNQLQIADCYQKLDRIDEALKYYKKAINNSIERDRFQPEAAYLSVLAKHNKHIEIMGLMKWMNSQIGRDKQVTYTRLHDFLVHQAALGILTEWTIPRAACVCGDVTFLTEALHKAVQLAIRQQDPAKELYLRLALGMLRYYSREYEKAIDIHVAILGIGSHLRGSLLVRRMHLMSLRSLALVYKTMAVATGINTRQAARWIRELDELQIHLQRHQHRDMPQRLIGLDVNDAMLYRGLIYRISGQLTSAVVLISSIIDESLTILVDDEPENDPYALDNICRALVAIGDVENARALYQSMRKPVTESLSMTALADSMAATMTTTTSSGNTGPGGTGNSDSLTQPLLPYVCNTPIICAQCLNTIGREPEFVVCMHCLDVLCVDCLEHIILPQNHQRALQKVLGRGTKKLRAELVGELDHEHPDGVISLRARRVIVCDPSHEWFWVPPMTGKLRRGEILLSDGRVESWEVWVESLKERYVGVSDRGTEGTDKTEENIIPELV